MFLDDDDEMLPGVIEHVSDVVKEHPGATVIGRVALNSPSGPRVWQTARAQFGNFCHPIMVVPRARLGSWSTDKDVCRRIGDQVFGMSCVKRATEVVWDDFLYGIVYVPGSPALEMGEMERRLGGS